LKQGLTESFGLVSELHQFADLGLMAWEDIEVGGHDIRDTKLIDEAFKLVYESRAIDGRIVEKCRAELDRIDGNIVDGTLLNVGGAITDLSSDKLRKVAETAREAIDRLKADIANF